MKTIHLFIFTALLCGSQLSAQVTMDMYNCPFQMGQEIHQVLYEGQTTFPKFSTTGVDNAWDFSTLTPDPGYDYVIAVLNNSTLPCPDEAPTANAIVVDYEPAFPEDAYYAICVFDEDSLTIIGEYDNTLSCDMMVDGIRYYRFPFAYGDVNSDNYEYGGGFAYSINMEYSAWGSLTLPNNMYYDQVALISFVDEFYAQYTFLAYVDGKFQIVMQLDNDGYYTIMENTFELSTKANVPAVFGIVQQGLNHYISNDQLPQDWEVYNSIGQRVMQAEQTPHITLEGLTTGTYIIRASRGEQHTTLQVFYH